MSKIFFTFTDGRRSSLKYVNLNFTGGPNLWSLRQNSPVMGKSGINLPFSNSRKTSTIFARCPYRIHAHMSISTNSYRKRVAKYHWKTSAMASFYRFAKTIASYFVSRMESSRNYAFRRFWCTYLPTGTTRPSYPKISRIMAKDRPDLARGLRNITTVGRYSSSVS